MNTSEQADVERFITDIESVSPQKATIVSKARNLFHKNIPDLTEGIKYGGLVFFQSGELVAGLFPYTNHVSIEFSDGVDFADSDGLLEGKGEHRRHLKLRSEQDIDDRNAGYFIAQAVGS